MIDLPKDWKIYYNSITDRCRDLIEYKIWSGVNLLQFDSWRKNFITDEEKYFSACVLDSLIYRSNQQTYSLIEDILFKNLNNQFRLLGLTNITNFPNMLVSNTVDPLIRLVPVITIHDPVTKSSNEILRFMKRHFFISEQWIINPWNIEDEIKKGVDVFIFIDDFLGTGSQFEDVIIMSNLTKTLQSKTFIYAPLVAHDQGVQYLKSQLPNLNVIHSEKFYKSNHSFFDNYFYEKQLEAKAFYVDMLKKRNINLAEGNEYGWGNLELTFAFEHAAPDNSLQILTYRTDSWSPLFNH